MYLELFKLKELPFRLSPDPQFLYLSKHHARAKAYMESTIWFTDGFVVITGEIGSGKTTLIETFLRELEQDVVVAQINQTQVSPTEFLQTVLVQFGFSPFKMKKAELLATLNKFLIEQYAAGRKVLLIVDEAQNLSTAGARGGAHALGRRDDQGEGAAHHPGRPAGAQREARCAGARAARAARAPALPPDGAEPRRTCSAYILHRLEVAGSGGREIFQDDTFPLIFRYTGGVPRLINTLCDTAMMAAFNEDRDIVTVDDVRGAIDELQWVEYAERGSTQPTRQRHRQLRHGRTPAHAARSRGLTLYIGARDEDVVLAKIIVANDGETVGEIATAPGPHDHRSHAGQRPADRQPVRQPPSLPDPHHARRAA